MKVSFFVVVLSEVIAVISETEALPRWKWKPNVNHEHWHDHSEKGDGCITGQCVQSWKCPEHATATEPTGSCTYWTHGPWVCCTLQYDGHYNSPKEFHKKPTQVGGVSTEWYPKQTTTLSWKQNSITTSTEGSKKEWNTTPFVKDRWNGNAKERAIPISSLAGLPANSWNRPNSNVTWSKPSKVPNFDAWKKTTSDIWNKRTTSNPHNSRTSINSHNSRTTPSSQNSWTTKYNKPSTLDSRIIFPTGSASWKWQTTNHSNPTTLSWIKTTRLSSTKRSTLSTKIPNNVGSSSEDRKNQGWTTPGYPIRETSTRFRNTYTPTTRTATTTKRSTPLPDVNAHLCGIRDQRPLSRRQGRTYKSNDDVIESTNTTGRNPFQRIVGGEESEPYSWPWVAALYKVASTGINRFLSAGSLINENFVLTAAHPFTRNDLSSSTYVVMLGIHNAEDALAEYRVSSVLQYPDYEQRFYYHDIALLRLVRPVAFNDFVMPVCLPSPNAPLLRDSELEGKKVTVMGWGDESFGGKSSRVLKEATVSIISRSSCNASYIRVASNRFPRGITENMLCAGDPNGGKDACQGDSGGPLTSVVRSRYIQVGIVSFGYQCGDKEYPGVYTKVAPYLSWIAENTERVEYYDYSNYDYGR